MLASRDLLGLVKILEVLADPVKYKDLIVSVRAEVDRNQALLVDIGQRELAIKAREERASKIILDETHRIAEIEQRAAVVKQREREIETAIRNIKVDQERVNHTRQEVEAALATVNVEKEAIAVDRARVDQLMIDLKAKISDVDATKAVLDKKRDKAMEILGS